MPSSPPEVCGMVITMQTLTVKVNDDGDDNEEAHDDNEFDSDDENGGDGYDNVNDKVVVN